MAGRLLCRYARLLSRSSSQVPAAAAAAAAAAARLPPHVGPTEGQRMSGRLLNTESLMLSKQTIDDQETGRFAELLKKAKDPENVLVAWSKEQEKSAHAAASALIRWASLMRMTQGKFENDVLSEPADSRLQDIVATLSNEVPSLWNSLLVSVLRILWTMPLPSTHPLLYSVQKEVLSRARRLTYTQLAQLLKSGAARKEKQDVLIVITVVKQLELRWMEIIDARTVSLLMFKAGLMNPQLMDKLQDKALELAESFSSEDIRKVCVSLAVQGRRCVPVLRALSYQLLQKPSNEFTTKLLLDLAFAYGKLNFHHSQVFQRMASELLPRTLDLSSAEVIRFAKSVSYLKWHHIPLLQSFAEHYIAKSDTYTTPMVSNLLMTFGTLGFQPTKEETFYNKVHLVLRDSLRELEPFQQTDVVWALCVLQQAKPSYLLPLTQTSHTNKLSDLCKDVEGRMESYQLKLLHIAATLQLEHPGVSTSVPDLKVPRSSSSNLSVLQSSLRESLHGLVGEKTQALRTGVHTVYGWTIDGEMVVDHDNIPMDLSQLNAPHLPGGGGNEPVPVGARRLAFLAWEFPNFCSKSKQLLGRFTMMKRHLQLAGFIIVEVPFYEWLALKTERQKLAYLKDQMGKAVAREMAK